MWMVLGDPGAPLLKWGVVLGVSLAAAINDVGTRRIPNWLTMPVLLAALVWAAWTAGWDGIADAVAACMLFALPFVVLFVLGAGGAGDAKLMGAIGAWLGTGHVLVTLACVLLAGGVLGIFYALAKGKGMAVARNLWNMGLGLFLYVIHRRRWSEVSIPSPREMQTMPYGVAIFAGTLAAALGEWLWHG